MSQEINNAILRLRKRAEKYSTDELVETFVDIGSLFIQLLSTDHQILYGRRGTGKTHILNYLCTQIKKNNNCAIYIDLRLIGSTGGLYSDKGIPFSERATRLLIDVFTAIHDQLFEYLIADIEADVSLEKIAPLLERLANAISEIKITGEVTKEYSKKKEDSSSEDSGIEWDMIKYPLFHYSYKTRQNNLSEEKTTNSGFENHRLHFPEIKGVIQEILKLIHPREIWIVLDEWAEIPVDIQPFLGDLLRRCLFPIYGISIKIGAIEHRSKFKNQRNLAEYIGIETGADVTSLNLDEFMVFDNNEYLSIDFFKNLLFKHINPLLSEKQKFRYADSLINGIFTQTLAFEELVRASEGVPRDAINILVQAATKASTSKISIKHIRDSARIWYNRDKEKAVTSSEEAIKLLRWIIDEVIGKRNARAFLLRTDIENQLIDYLYDSRVIHIIKQSISGLDAPGIRYNVYSIDYGCYVDLITTSRSPKGLFPIENQDGEVEYVTVPQNDYRTIRRAVLDLNEFNSII